MRGPRYANDVRFAVVIAVLVAGCASHRVVPYQSEVQNVRTHGGATLDIVMERDPAVRDYVEQHGAPDYVLVPDPRNVELIYYRESRLVQFHRAEGATAAGELSPLPLEVVNVLPPDIRAGTPGPIGTGRDRPLTGCWHVDVGADRCRTCCESPRACTAQCRAATPG